MRAARSRRKPGAQKYIRDFCPKRKKLLPLETGKYGSLSKIIKSKSCNVTDRTLNAWCKRTYGAGFSEIFRQKRGKGKISLRRHQMRLAEKNATMAIWLGKQYLGQTDKPEESVDMEDTDAYLKEAGIE